MAWKGGFSGVGYDREEFRKWLATQKKPLWAKFIVAHETDAPFVIPPVATNKRIKNLENYYRVQKKWSGGPQLFVIHKKVYGGTPISEPGVHCPGWSNISLACEVEGAYTRKLASPTTGDGGAAWDTMAWVFAEVLLWMGWEANADRIRLHYEGATTHTCCRGIDKTWFINKVRQAMGVGALPEPKPVTPQPKPTNIPKPVSKQLYDVKTIQERLLVHGYSLPKFGADGLIGAETIAAIKAMQANLGITPSGLVGPWMWDQLKKAPPAKPVPKQPEPVPVAIPSPVITPPPQIVAPGAGEPNPAKAMRLLQVEAKWPKHWAAGAVAQAQRESYPDLRPWAQGDYFLDGKPSKRGVEGAKPTAFGIWQHRDDRWDNYLSFAATKGKAWDDFETQVMFCPYELKTSEKLAWRWLQLATTIEQACAAMVWYERPKGYIAAKAKAATTWEEVFAVSEKCDGWDARLKFAKALM